MTPARLERKIRAGLKKHGLRLQRGAYFGDPALMGRRGAAKACAIGGALAYAAKTKGELYRMANVGGFGVTAEEAARLLNHGLTADDMLHLEAGFENYPALHGGIGRDVERKNPFYLLGKKLARERVR